MFLQIHRVYTITLWFLFQLFIEINCQLSPYVLKERFDHTATLFDEKLYILGGFPLNEIGKEFFYIDFSVSFNTQNIKVNDLSDFNTLPPHFSAGSAMGGAVIDTLFICGGVNDVKVTKMELVNTFNPRINSWKTPVITGIIPILYDATIGIIDYNGKMYFWDGIGDIAILNTKNLIWEKRSSIGAPIIGLRSTATLLPDNKIIYMDSSTSSLTEVYIYDTITNNWSTKTTTGTIPPKRIGFSAVLGLDGKRVITFGGIASQDSLHELNLINFEWRIPKTSGSTPKSRSKHKANVIGNYMVISFGLGYNKNNENDILLLDISNLNEYIWTNEFNPLSSGKVVASSAIATTSAVGTITAKTAPIPSPSLSPKVYEGFGSQESNNISSKVGVIVVFLVSGVILSIIVAFLIRRCRNRIINESNYNQYEAENYSYYPVQDTIQPPVPASLINNDINRNGNAIVYYNQAESNNYYPMQEIVQHSIAINNNIDRNRNENSNNNYQAERNNDYLGQEIVQQPAVINNDINRNRNDYYPGQEIVQPPASASVINTSYNHGRESVPIANDELQILKQEIQDLKQIILQNNKQSTSSTSNN